MLERLRPRSAYDVIALLALFVAVGTGGAYAANTIRSEDIVDGEVKNADIGANAMTSSKLANGSVQNSDLGPDAVTTSKIKAGNVGATDLAANAVTGAKVQAASRADITESSLGAVQADTLDGFDWTFFRRPARRRTNSELLDGLDSEDFLGATAKAADSDQLDGRDSKELRPVRRLVNERRQRLPGDRLHGRPTRHGRVPGRLPGGTLVERALPAGGRRDTFSGLVRHPQLSGRGCSGLGAGNFTIKLSTTTGWRTTRRSRSSPCRRLRARHRARARLLDLLRVRRLRGRTGRPRRARAPRGRDHRARRACS